LKGRGGKSEKERGKVREERRGSREDRTYLELRVRDASDG